ncbi:MAG: hypothetical protein KDD53_07860 [Bdellovibrionales bacterium]|nr:hypothetical protein [Bdellovibrionales bacterium]
MVATFRQWIASQELLLLASRESFEAISPDKVLRILERFALSKVHPLGQIAERPKILRRLDQRQVAHQAALLQIWEKAKDGFQSDLKHRPGWHRVMATCNALQEPYLKLSNSMEACALAA